MPFQSEEADHDTPSLSVASSSHSSPSSSLTEGIRLSSTVPQAQPRFQAGLLRLRIAQLLSQQMARLILAVWYSTQGPGWAFYI